MSALDMSLDDRIKSSRKPKPAPQQQQQRNGGSSNRGGRNDNGRSGPVRSDRNQRNGNARSNAAPYARPPQQRQQGGFNDSAMWSHDLFAPEYASAPVAAKKVEPSVKVEGSIFVSGLAEDLDENQVAGVFEDHVGKIQSITINYDRSGRSLGTATITFADSKMCQKAVKELDNAMVEDKQLSIKIVGSMITPPVTVQKAAQPMQAMQQMARMYMMAPNMFSANQQQGAFRQQNSQRDSQRASNNNNNNSNGRQQQQPQRQQQQRPQSNKGNGNARQNGNSNKGGKPAAKAPKEKREGGFKKVMSQEELDADMDSYYASKRSTAAVSTEDGAAETA